MRTKLTEAQLDAKLKGNLLYEGLNDSQKQFVRVYIQNDGDLTDANFPQHKVYRYRKAERVVALLRVFGFNLQESMVQSKELLRLISRRLRLDTTSNEDFIRLATLAQELQPKIRSKKKAAPKSIDEAVLEAEKKA